jgi:UDP-glucose:(heptosyl)LPS alpha-1,3-glucosyltransferase
VVYNAVDIPQNAGIAERQLWRNEIRTQMGVAMDEPLYLTVANNLKLKGVDWLIKAFAKRGGQGRVVVIGSKDFAEMESLAASLGLAGRVIFREHVDNIFKWYSAADAAVLLSWQDACSRVILESVRWGLPSMSTQFNGASEVLCDGAGVVVSRPDDIDAVIAGLDRLADADERRRFTAACAAAGEKLTWQRHCMELLEIYAKVMERK